MKKWELVTTILKSSTTKINEHRPSSYSLFTHFLFDATKTHLIIIEEKKVHRDNGFSSDDDNKKYHKVRYHCHYTGKYRGVARNICNLRYKTPKEIPAVFHTGSTY